MSRCALVAFVGILAATNVAIADPPPLPSIEVSGAADVKVVPDEIVIRMGVESRDMSIDKAKQDNDERVRKILGIAKDAHIDSKDVQTDYVRISPQYEHEDFKTVFKGYQVETSVAVILHNIKEYDSLVSSL